MEATKCIMCGAPLASHPFHHPIYGYMGNRCWLCFVDDITVPMALCSVCEKQTDRYSEDYPLYLCSPECEEVIEITLDLVKHDTMCIQSLLKAI